ncbi:MAG: hypothetical protein J7J78_01330 [Thermoprotei archaeon]|nr:hypothetical protein [Thermoprotei archaeon]
MDLEDEVGLILQSLIKEKSEYNYKRNVKIRGASGHSWEADFVLYKEGKIDAIIECKDISSKNIQTFDTQMCRAYTRLNDLRLKYPQARYYVIVRELPRNTILEKWGDIFRQVSIELLSLEMLKELPFEDTLLT